MLDDGAPDVTEDAYLMTMPRLAHELRDLAKRTTRPEDAMRKAVLLEAASRIGSKYAYAEAIKRDDNRIRGLNAFGKPLPTDEENT